MPRLLIRLSIDLRCFPPALGRFDRATVLLLRVASAVVVLQQQMWRVVLRQQRTVQGDGFILWRQI